tara:strand:- start:92 stop:238 length:147 start_codon:yes stop_codon:yes gene_type:complete
MSETNEYFETKETDDRRKEVNELKKAGYTPKEIDALLSTERWSGFGSI